MVYIENNSNQKYLRYITNKWNLKHNPKSVIKLIINSTGLELKHRHFPNLGTLKVNFTKGSIFHRSFLANKKNELLAKAIGIKKNFYPFVLDATAGLGRDAFILSTLGCKVHMFERNPIVAALLFDGLNRAYTHIKVSSWLKKRLFFSYGSSFKLIKKLKKYPDVIYLDPMFAIKKKALSKKEMNLLKFFVGNDSDARDLLNFSFCYAKHRIVIKRPRSLLPFFKKKVTYSIKTKKYRFDIYLSSQKKIL
ncbi:class I SAM-dependent methyltransferase [Buchnera aphidicola (Mindarus keteleerifoliae)]|uniref:class I SAM-dependent methyltransferase n=1 Tax=Buchnera aphidicola TaxID=9 RepID=UPI0031B6CA0A